MNVGTEHFYNIMRGLPKEAVATDFLANCCEQAVQAERSQVISCRDEAYQRLALEYFDARHGSVRVGVDKESIEAVHEALAKALAALQDGGKDEELFLSAMAGWYLTADQRYRTALMQATGFMA